MIEGKDHVCDEPSSLLNDNREVTIFDLQRETYNGQATILCDPQLCEEVGLLGIYRLFKGCATVATSKSIHCGVEIHEYPVTVALRR